MHTNSQWCVFKSAHISKQIVKADFFPFYIPKGFIHCSCTNVANWHIHESCHCSPKSKERVNLLICRPRVCQINMLCGFRVLPYIITSSMADRNMNAADRTKRIRHSSITPCYPRIVFLPFFLIFTLIFSFCLQLGVESFFLSAMMDFSQVSNAVRSRAARDFF